MKNLTIPPVSKITIPTHSNKRSILIGIGILIIIGAVFFWYRASVKPNVNQQQEEVKTTPSINGSLVSEEQSKLRPLAVVVENHTDSRPQSGLNDAEIVYETLAEGGITRFLAIFQTREPKEIGPVRSARPYFNFLANMWSAPLIHAGGSKQALSELSSGVYPNLYDINEFYNGDYFYRSKTRPAPHNLFTTIQKQRELLQKKEQSNWEIISPWKTKITAQDQLAPEINNITIPFSIASYEVKYQYNREQNAYLRSIGSEATIDNNTSEQIKPKNVLVMLTDIAENPGDELLTVNIKLNGDGPCYLFSAGKFTQCRWEFKNNKYYYADQEENELVFEAGQTWIEIFPRDRQNEIKWN